MKNKTLLFFDQEFSGLHQNTTLISLGIVSECGKTFYAEYNDYSVMQCNDWIKENVLANLNLEAYSNNQSLKDWKIKGNSAQIKEALTTWLAQFDKIKMVSDCLAYDWVLFCEIFGGAFGIPENIHYIPVYICTMFEDRDIDPDINREEFADLKNGSIKHNALWDAFVIMECYYRLKKITIK